MAHRRKKTKTKPMVFKDEKALREAIDFDGQTFFLKGQALGEIDDDLQFNWEELTPEVIEREKGFFIDYLKETGKVKYKWEM